MRVFAKELVDPKPDIILSNTTVATAALKYKTQTIPIVCAVVADTIGSGFVASMPRPGGHITGFSLLEALLAMPDNFNDIHHAAIIALAARSCRRRIFVTQNSKVRGSRIF
jgi:ABC transporter substrate binding protein